MMKLLWLLALLVPTLSQAKVEARWLSVASILLDDGETQLLFDAAYTRPTFVNWVGLSKFKSDKNVVKKMIEDHRMIRLKGVFATHSHFDHIVDIPMIASMTGAKLYLSESAALIARAYKDPEMKIEKLAKVSIGKFTISHFPRVHALIMGMLDFLPGPVPLDFDFAFYDYKVGESWVYLIEHPEGKILIDTSGDANLGPLPRNLKIDVVFQGVANRQSNEKIINGYVNTLNAKMFVAIHFDAFMLSFTPGHQEPLRNVDFEGLKKSFAKDAPETRFVIPEYGEAIDLFNPPKT